MRFRSRPGQDDPVHAGDALRDLRPLDVVAGRFEAVDWPQACAAMINGRAATASVRQEADRRFFIADTIPVQKRAMKVCRRYKLRSGPPKPHGHADPPRQALANPPPRRRAAGRCGTRSRFGERSP
jgi:hypothetical protein